MESSEKERVTATFCVAASVFTYGSVPIFLRFFKDHLDPWTVNAVRYSIAALLMLPFVLVLRKRTSANNRGARADCEKSGQVESGRTTGSGNIWRDALIPSVVNIVGQVGWALSPYYKVEAATMGFVTRSSFLFAVLLGFLLIPKERLLARKPLFLAGAAVSAGGVVIMFLQKVLGEGGFYQVGMAILVGTAVFWGAYAVCVRRYLGGYSLRVSFGVVSIYTASALVVLMLLLGDYSALARLGDKTVKVWLLLPASAVVGMVFSHLLYYRGIHGLGPVTANGIIMGAPFVTYVGAWVLLGEEMTLVQFLGGLTVVAGGVLLVKAKAQIERQKAQPGEFVGPDR